MNWVYRGLYSSALALIILGIWSDERFIFTGLVLGLAGVFVNIWHDFS